MTPPLTCPPPPPTSCVTSLKFGKFYVRCVTCSTLRNGLEWPCSTWKRPIRTDLALRSTDLAVAPPPSKVRRNLRTVPKLDIQRCTYMLIEYLAYRHSIAAYRLSYDRMKKLCKLEQNRNTYFAYTFRLRFYTLTHSVKGETVSNIDPWFCLGVLIDAPIAY